MDCQVSLPGPMPQGLTLRLFSIPDLLSRFLARPPGPDYRVRPAQAFDAKDFLIPFLSPGELERLNGFRVLKKQVEWACGRFGAKTLVQEILMPEKALTRIRIRYQDLGAPYLPDHPDLSLSLTHSQDLTAVALGLTPDLVLGIDLEAIGPMPDQGFMRTAFTQREIKAMAPGPESLFKTWTLKEAYLKYIGKGFNESLHQVEILDSTILHGGRPRKVTCHAWTLSCGYALGLVTGNRGVSRGQKYSPQSDGS